MNKESKIIRGILLGFTAAGYGVAAGIYIRQIYRSVSNTQEIGRASCRERVSFAV